MSNLNRFLSKWSILPEYQDAGLAIDPSKLSREQYQKLYDEGRVATYDKAADVYQPPVLPEVSISAKAPKSVTDFGRRFRKKLQEDNPSLAAQLFKLPVEAVAGLPQAAFTYLLDPEKNIVPSQALDVQNPYAAMAVDVVADPTNLVGLGVADDVLKVSGKLGKAGSKAGKYLTTETPVRNAWKLNPNRLNLEKKLAEENLVARQIFGDEAYESFLKQGPTTRPEIPESEMVQKWNSLKRMRQYNPDTQVEYNYVPLEGRGFEFPYFAQNKLWYGKDVVDNIQGFNRVDKKTFALPFGLRTSTGSRRVEIPFTGIQKRKDISFYGDRYIPEKTRERILVADPKGSDAFVHAGEKGIYEGLPSQEVNRVTLGRRVLKPGTEFSDPSQYTVYEPHWWEGYKQVPVNKPSSAGEVNDLVDLWRIQERGAKPMSELAAANKLGPLFNNQKAIQTFKDREKYFGQWFTKDKDDLDFYRSDREFRDPEIIQLQVPQSRLSEFQNYDKSLSRAPDREFVVPPEQQDLFKINKQQKGGLISKLGYKKNSPYKDSPFLEIDSNYITMDGVDQPLVLYPDGDSPMVVQPNSGNYLFPNSTSVTEVPLKEFKKGGLKSSQRDLVEWTNQKWRTKSGKPSHKTGERYLPEAAINALTDEEYRQTSRKKKADGSTGSVSKQPEKIADKVRPYRMKEGGSTVNQAGNYTKPGMRKRLFNQIMNSNTMGTPSGKWSARKAQLLAKKYKEQGGGYKEQGGLVDYYVDNTPVMLMMNGGCMECGGMVKYEGGGYVIKKGDTLSKVSKETGIALQDIIAANNIKDPNKVQIGQSLVLPTSSVPQKKENIEINPDSNSYTIKKNDSLGAIAKKYNVSVQDLAKANNIENVNKITTGQKINIPTAASPYSNKELVKTYKEQKKKENPKVPVTYDDKQLYRGLDESKINNEQVVLDHLKGKEPFVLIDKKTNTLKRYDKSGNIIGEMRVGLGSDKGDKFTINSKNKKVDRNTTPGGVYIVDEQNPNESYRHLYDNNILLLKSQAGLRQATSIHQVPSGSVKRDQWLADNNLTNDDFSNGCINCNKEQFEKYLKTVGAGEKVVILPEEEGNYFTVKNGALSFTTNKNKEFGQYNFTPKSKEYKPLTYNFNTDTEVKSKYVDALKNEKKKLMKDLNLTSDEYDELAKRAYGILGQESSFGFGSFNPLRDYKIEKWYTLAADDPEERKKRSLGLSQVRLSNVDPKFAEKYGIDTKTLYYPYQAALATMNVLADGLQAVRNPKIRDQYENMTPENVYDYVTTFYNKPETVRRGEASGKNTYVQNVNRNYQASESQPAMAKIKQYQQGGTVQSFLNKWL